MNGALRVRNSQVSGHSNYKRAAPMFNPEVQRIHMLIAAIDYVSSSQPLSSVALAKQLEELVTNCGSFVKTTTLYDKACTKDAVRRFIKNTGMRCAANDYFVFYFAGHATSMSDPKKGGQDEAFVLVDPNGKASGASLFLDEDFADIVLANFKPETRIVILTDCGHPVPVVDITRERWNGRQVIFISGTEDIPSSGEDSARGIFTQALLLAIDKLSKVGRDNYSAGMLCNALLLENELVFKCKQDIEIQTPCNVTPDALAWPLVPVEPGYESPLNRCAAAPGGIEVEENLEHFGIPYGILQYVEPNALNAPVPVEEYLTYLQGQSALQLKPCRACSKGCSTDGCFIQ